MLGAASVHACSRALSFVMVGFGLVPLGCEAGSERGEDAADAAVVEVDSGPVGEVHSLSIDGLAYGAARFVAVGAEWTDGGSAIPDYRGVIFVSQDGATWTRAATDLPVVVSDVSYGNGRFVAVGNSVGLTDRRSPGPSHAYVSEDGEHWTTVVLDPGMSLHMAFGNDLFVIGGQNAHWRSSDGLSWTRFGPSAGWPGGVDFASGVFVSWGLPRPVVRISTGDGDWSDAPFEDAPFEDDPGIRLLDLTVVNDRFVGITVRGFGEPGSPLSYSPTQSDDGSHWTRVSSLATKPLLTVIEDDSVCVALGYEAVHSGPDCESLDVTYTDSSFDPTCALQAEGLYLVGGAFGGILTSADGTTWTKAALEASE